MNGKELIFPQMMKYAKKYLQSHLLGKQINSLPTTQLNVKEASALKLIDY